MDALDEFFATWSEPEAWCEMCGDNPAIHIVLRDTEGKYGGIMSHVRIWNPATQTRMPVCRHCCKDQVELLGQSVKHARDLEGPGTRRRLQLSIPIQFLQPTWLRNLFTRLKLVFYQGSQRLRRPKEKWPG